MARSIALQPLKVCTHPNFQRLITICAHFQIGMKRPGNTLRYNAINMVYPSIPTASPMSWLRVYLTCPLGLRKRVAVTTTLVKFTSQRLRLGRVRIAPSPNWIAKRGRLQRDRFHFHNWSFRRIGWSRWSGLRWQNQSRAAPGFNAL